MNEGLTIVFNRECNYRKMLSHGVTEQASVNFRREPYYLTAARREKGIILDDYSARGEKAVTDESRESE